MYLLGLKVQYNRKFKLLLDMVSKHVFLYLQLPDYTADYKNLVLAAGPLIYKICHK